LREPSFTPCPWSPRHRSGQDHQEGGADGLGESLPADDGATADAVGVGVALG